MIPSIGSIHEKFAQFNKQMFEGVLETIPMDITTAKNFLGYIKFKTDFDESDKPRFYNFIFCSRNRNRPSRLWSVWIDRG